MSSKSNPHEEPGAFPAREWLRKLVVGKTVRFQTRKQGASAGDRIYGWLFLTDAGAPETNLAIECVRLGNGTPKAVKFPKTTSGDETATPAAATATAPEEATEEEEYEKKLSQAYKEAQENKRGIHADLPLVRTVKNAGDDFAVLALVEACQKLASQKRITCVIEHVFDGSRVRCQITDPQLPQFQYANFTLLLAGITCPRIGNPTADPRIPTEAFAQEARQFVSMRLLQRELPISLLGTDKVGMSAVGSVHHPVGNIALELLKVGLARMTDWSVRLMPVGEVPALRIAENNAKRTLQGIWHSYAPPALTSASQIRGTVVEALSGDTLLLLPEGKAYTNDDVLVKVSLASIRAPRTASSVVGREDEPYAQECKDRLRSLTVGKSVTVDIHYERDIPIRPGENEKRPFGTVSVTEKYPDIAEVLISEGLAVTQRHRDEDEKSPRYDELRAAEAAAKAAKKGVHKEGTYKAPSVNDLTEPRKAKAYSGSLMRAGTLKAVVDYVFNGALFKLYVPAENCHIRFSPSYIRCPQPSPSPGSKQQTKPAEPFGDEAKCHARLHVLQRQVEINCNGVTNSGIITGSMYTGFGNNRQDYTIELLGAGFASLDPRKVEYNEVPRNLLDAEETARKNKVGLWSLEQPKSEVKVSTNEKFGENITKARLSEIRSGSHFFYQLVGDEALSVMDESMILFTRNNGTAGAPCDPKVGKVVAALFDDGTGKRWYRAKIIERHGPAKATVLFVDYGNVATVPAATHLRPLDMSLGTDRIPPVAKEAVLALTVTRPLQSDEGVAAARMLQSLCWGKDLVVRTFAIDENGKMAVALAVDGSDETVNAKLVSEGLARVAKQSLVDVLSSRMVNGNSVVELAADLNVAQNVARKSRVGMWRYGDIGDDDPDDV
jgi:staphylococcal nuclease domain-containing protein 1